jgi:biotin synthase-like enzyme
MLHTLATLEEHPESVPINALVAIEGTPLAEVCCIHNYTQRVIMHALRADCSLYVVLTTVQ